MKPPYVQANTQDKNPSPKVDGISVKVRGDSDRDFMQALRIFNKKVQDAGIIREVRERQHYEKPTTERKRKAQLARKRWLKKKAASMPAPKETRGKR